jgi:hypothetical protein
MLGLITFSLILLALLVGTWRRPAVGVSAVLCLYGLKQWGQASTQLFSDYREVANFAVFLICLLGVARAATRRACLFCGQPATAWLVLAMYVYAFISILWAPDTRSSLDQWIASAPYLVTITLLAPLLVDDLDDLRTAFVATAIAGASLCILALAFGHWGDRGLVVFGHQAYTDDLNLYRYETNPLALSTMAGTVFLISALSLGRANGILMRLLALAAIPVALVVILKSGSRGQLVATGLGVMVALPIAFKPKDGKSLGALIAVGAVVVLLGWWATSFTDLTGSRWTSATLASEDVAGRLSTAQTLLGASTAHLSTTLFGLGNSSAFQVVGYYPHITVLEVIAEEGIVGTMIYAAILVSVLMSIVRASGRRLSASQRYGLAVAGGLFVFELVISWKQGSLLFSAYVFAYAIMLSRLAGRPEQSAVEHERPLAEAPLYSNLLR